MQQFLQRLTTERAAALILFMLIFTMATRIPTDTDMWWHLRSGQYMLEERQMLYADPFSHTFAGQPRVNYGWASQIILYLSWQAAGSVGLMLYTAVLATSGMFVLYRTCRGSTYSRAFIIVVGAAAAALFWSPRQQMMTFFLSTVLLYLLYRYKRDGVDRLWWIVPLMLVWGNMHAGYFIGYIILGIFIAGEIANNLLRAGDEVISWQGLRRPVLVGVVSLPVLLLNPDGLELLRVPFSTFSIGELRMFIQEWQPPDFNNPQTWPFIALLLMVIGSVWGSRKRFDWTEFGLVAVPLFLALTASRNVSFFAVAVLPLVAYHTDDILRARGLVLRSLPVARPTQAYVNLVLVLLILCVPLANLLTLSPPAAVYAEQSKTLPVDAVEYLNTARPPGPIFNSYNWGGYLLFFAPDYPVFIDGRTDLYLDFTITYYQIAIAAGNWREALDEYGINLVLVETQSGLARRLLEEPGWTVGHRDELAIVFLRE